MALPKFKNEGSEFQIT